MRIPKTIELDDVRTWPVEIGYFLELEHGSMGFFPAVFTAYTPRIVVVFDIKLLFDVWRKMKPRSSKMRQCLFFADKEYGIGYPVQEAEYWIKEGHRGPIKFLSQKEFDGLIAELPEPFMWMPGIIGATITENEFMGKIGLVEDAATDTRL